MNSAMCIFTLCSTKNNWHPSPPYDVTHKLNAKVRRLKGMTTNLKTY